MLGNQWYRKERPLLSLLGMGGGAGKGSSSAMATGGTEYEPGNGYRYHVYTCNPSPGSNPLSDSPFTANQALPGAQILLVAGGGSGGSYYGAGGGAGGLCWSPQTFTMNAGAYNVVVGAGGATVPTSSNQGNKGDNSAFGPPTDGNDILSHGGGAGGRLTSTPTNGGGQSGGSGGGKGSQPGGPHSGNAATQPGVPTPPYMAEHGAAGGGYNPNLSGYAPGGGGGAGGNGNSGTQQPGGGNGGPGLPCPGFEYPLVGLTPYAFSPTGDNSGPYFHPANNHYAGGGGAGCYGAAGPVPARNGSGGVGGGGMGHNTGTSYGYGEKGFDGLGGGGGGYHPCPTNKNNKAGNGICIIRYPIS